MDREGTKIDSFPHKFLLCSQNENYLYFRLKTYSVKLICRLYRSLCVLLTVTSKSRSINSFSLSMIKIFLCAKNRFIASAFFSKLHLWLWGFPVGMSFEESFLPGRHCWSKRRPQAVLLLSIFQWFNLIIYSLNTYRLNDYYDTMCSNWDRTKTWFSVMTVSICVFSKK